MKSTDSRDRAHLIELERKQSSVVFEGKWFVLVVAVVVVVGGT